MLLEVSEGAAKCVVRRLILLLACLCTVGHVIAAATEEGSSLEAHPTEDRIDNHSWHSRNGDRLSMRMKRSS